MDITAVLVDHEEQEHPLTGAMNVGRSADCTLTIDDAKVSRVHATFRVDGGQLVVEDMGSSNGTRVNELKIDKPTPVYNGDKICFEKHCYKLQVAGGAQDMDATVVDSDATVVSAFEEPALQASAPVAESQPAESSGGSPVPRSLDDLDLPGSWVDDGTGDETRVLSMDQAGAADNVEKGTTAIERMSDLAHLIVVTETGSAGEVFELAPGGTEEPDVWELGRDADCELNIPDPSVSGRHAQLIHQGGRWRLVNLVSANGIYVNGEKRLTAYLADEDRIQLGEATVVFRASLNAAAAAPGAGTPADSGSGGNASGSALKTAVAVGGGLALLLLIAWFALG